VLLLQWTIIFYLDKFAVYYTIYTSLNILGDEGGEKFAGISEFLGDNMGNDNWS